MDCQAVLTSGLRDDEMWCNAAAAEFLVPAGALHAELHTDGPLPDVLTCLARVFKVRGLVVLRRLLDIGWLTRTRFEAAWGEETEGLRFPARRDGDGGDFYRTTLSRVGRRLAKALVVSTVEGQTLYRDAFRMLGVRRGRTFDEVARQVIAAP